MARGGAGAGGPARGGAGAGAAGGAPAAEVSRLSTDVKASIATWLRKRGKAVRPEMSRSQREEIKVTRTSPPPPPCFRGRGTPPRPPRRRRARPGPRPGDALPSPPTSSQRAVTPPRGGRPRRGPARNPPPGARRRVTACMRSLGGVERAGGGARLARADAMVRELTPAAAAACRNASR